MKSTQGRTAPKASFLTDNDPIFSYRDISTRTNATLATGASIVSQDYNRLLALQKELLASPMWRTLCQELEGLRDDSAMLGERFLYASAQIYIAAEEAGRRAEVSR